MSLPACHVMGRSGLIGLRGVVQTLSVVDAIATKCMFCISQLSPGMSVLPL